MIRIEMNIMYDRPLTDAEKVRFAEAVGRMLQPAVVSTLCTQVRDAEPPEYDPEMIRSQFLNCETKVVPL